MICQSIIPGILNNNDLTELAVYGLIEEKNDLVNNPDFHEKMLKVTDQLDIINGSVEHPTSGKKMDMAGCVEVKGIKGSDKRMYIVDT